MPDHSLLAPVEIELTLQTEFRHPEEIIADVENELQKRLEAFGPTLIVRTDIPTARTAGGLFLTARESHLYTGMPHAKVVKATVLAAGERATLKPGDRVCFQRLHFAWLYPLQDRSYVGKIDENHLLMQIESD